MHVILSNPALGLPASNRHGRALPMVRRGVRLLGAAAQGVVFFAVLWLLAAAPGFLSARDSLLPDRPAQAFPVQASR